MRWLERLVATAVLSMSIALAGVGASYGQDKVVRIGFQKYGKLVLLKSKGTLEDKLKAAGYKVVWTEFPSGPPLLEALKLSVAIGLPVDVVEVALKRQSYGIKPITDSVIADQQQVADTFFALGLLPKQIKISDAARRPGT